jgi:phosphatidate phosphatase APP1
VLKAGDARKFTGVAMPLPTNGLSVISDLDDTIKVSEVRDHGALIRRTFLQPFEPVTGMAELYRAWATNGAQFHYVTASPWQLHIPLVEFAGSNGFPAGSWHMKQWRLKDRTFRSLFEDPREYKVGNIAPLLWQSPGRRFVLVGDSGERDPEAYAALAREFPKQVAAIYIRDVTGESAAAERYQTNFAGLPRELWRVFEKPSELPRSLPR